MDKLLRVTPFINGKREEIPSEKRALEILINETSKMVPPAIEAGEELLLDIQNVALELQRNGLPPYPSLPFDFDSNKVEEIRRTVVVCNLDESISGQQVLDHFSGVGEVKYIRFCKRNSDGEYCCLVEFSKHESIIPSLKLNNSEIVEGRKVKVYHSVHAIEKSMEEITNGVVINRLASSLIEAACYETLVAKNADLRQKSSTPEYSRSDSYSRRSRKHRKHKYERGRHRSRDRRSKSKSDSRRSKSSEIRRYRSREGRRRSHDMSDRESKRSGSRGRSMRSAEKRASNKESKSKEGSSERSKCEKNESKKSSLNLERKSGEKSHRKRSRSSSRERSDSKERTRLRSKNCRSRSRSQSRSKKDKYRSKSERSRSRKSSNSRKKSRSRSQDKGSKSHRK